MAEQKKGLIYRLTMGKDNLPDFMPDKLPGSRWALFKDVFFNRIGAMAKISLLTLLFFIPLIVVIVIFTLLKQSMETIIPYSGNLGLSPHPVIGAEAMGQAQELYLNLIMLLFTIPAVIIAGIGLAGAFHVMKMLAWEEGDSVANNFFIGIKKNIKQFLPMSVISAVFIFLFAFAFTTYTNTDAPSTLMAVFSTIGLVLSIIFFVIFLCALIFMTTQAVTYDLKFRHLIKNSLLFAIALLPTNLFFLFLSVLPILIILLIPLPAMFSVLLWMVYALIGIAYTILVWTVYAHWAYDRFVNDRVEGAVKNRGMHIKTPEEEKAAEIEMLKTRNVVYGSAYVSRRIKSIDEGTGFTPLSENFSRADLARMQTEKKQMKEEYDEEVQRINADLEKEILAYDEAQKQAKKRKKPGQNKPAQRLQSLPEADEPTDLGDLAETVQELDDAAVAQDAGTQPSEQKKAANAPSGGNKAKVKIVTKKGGKK